MRDIRDQLRSHKCVEEFANILCETRELCSSAKHKMSRISVTITFLDIHSDVYPVAVFLGKLSNIETPSAEKSLLVHVYRRA